VLFWLNLIAKKRQTVADIVHEHWQKFGRDIYCRHDMRLSKPYCQQYCRAFANQLPTLPGQSFGEYVVKYADEFSYEDPIDGSIVKPGHTHRF